MKMKYLKSSLSIAVATLGFFATQAWAVESPQDARMIERGRYVAKVSGCNDCHTPGYFQTDGNVQEQYWLSGDNFGWRGPWGTTYASNLRLFVKDMTEEEWVQAARTLKRKPPMPWFNLNVMQTDDLRALYHFIKSLGDPGMPAPAYVPPDQEPATPYAQFPSPPPKD